MGALEKRAKKIDHQKLLLGCIAGAGVLGVGLVVPNALQALKLLEEPLGRTFDPRYAMRRSFNKLIRDGYITLVQTPKGKGVRLTPRGEQKLLQAQLKGAVAHRQKRRWDKRWRLLIFDIPEEKRWMRDKLRNTLISIGFVRLQNSIWVFPYDCEDLITLLKADLRVGRDVLYLISDALEDDERLRKIFGL